MTVHIVAQDEAEAAEAGLEAGVRHDAAPALARGRGAHEADGGVEARRRMSSMTWTGTSCTVDVELPAAGEATVVGPLVAVGIMGLSVCHSAAACFSPFMEEVNKNKVRPIRLDLYSR